jgi:hypothetical protein
MRNRNCGTDAGTYRDSTRLELDRLFGWALTDSRFFRQLSEEPYRAIAEFDLTEAEKQAVLRIAPLARSVEDLAMRLDAWMTGSERGVVAVVPAEQAMVGNAAIGGPPIASRVVREGHAPGRRLHKPRTPVHNGDGEQRVCLTLSKRIYRS